MIAQTLGAAFVGCVYAWVLGTLMQTIGRRNRELREARTELMWARQMLYDHGLDFASEEPQEGQGRIPAAEVRARLQQTGERKLAALPRIEPHKPPPTFELLPRYFPSLKSDGDNE